MKTGLTIKVAKHLRPWLSPFAIFSFKYRSKGEHIMLTYFRSGTKRNLSETFQQYRIVPCSPDRIPIEDKCRRLRKERSNLKISIRNSRGRYRPTFNSSRYVHLVNSIVTSYKCYKTCQGNLLAPRWYNKVCTMDWLLLSRARGPVRA